jgi:hypothetical protein
MHDNWIFPSFWLISLSLSLTSSPAIAQLSTEAVTETTLSELVVTETTSVDLERAEAPKKVSKKKIFP